MNTPIPAKKRLTILKIDHVKFVIGDELNPTDTVKLLSLLSDLKKVEDTYVGGDVGYVHYVEDKTEITIGFEAIRLADDRESAEAIRLAHNASAKPANSIDSF